MCSHGNAVQAPKKLFLHLLGLELKGISASAVCQHVAQCCTTALSYMTHCIMFLESDDVEVS